MASGRHAISFATNKANLIEMAHILPCPRLILADHRRRDLVGDLDVPHFAAVGRIVSTTMAGALHHQYVRNPSSWHTQVAACSTQLTSMHF
jgi:hypothetical protein